ncbi:MAG: PIN domain-containing protein [Caldilineaceae bacterium]|nr:PIN domain-containing protein [Caldilineaceae bacterium]
MQPRLRVFFDSSVIIAGSFSSEGASYILLQLAGLTLLDGRISSFVRIESERNIRQKLPAALPAFHTLLNEALTEDAEPTEEQIAAAANFADAKDVHILAAALHQKCHYLITLNERDFWPAPEQIHVLRPGPFLQTIRAHINQLESDP